VKKKLADELGLHFTKTGFHRFGWRPDRPDFRDYRYKPVKPFAALPARVDLTPGCPERAYHQKKLNSCTGNAIAAAIQFLRIKRAMPGARDLVPSRLFIYYNERAMENDTANDSGAYVRDGIKSVVKQGVCFEAGKAAWPYTKPFATRPDAACYKLALDNQAITYSRLRHDAIEMKTCLAEGYPFVFGFSYYTSFLSDAVEETGMVPMPKRREKDEGGHTALVIGYDDADKTFLVRNSWGPDWGMKGNCKMPYAYLTNADLCDDFWTIRSVEQG
jgi:C1A family cysteine protease